MGIGAEPDQWLVVDPAEGTLTFMGILAGTTVGDAHAVECLRSRNADGTGGVPTVVWMALSAWWLVLVVLLVVMCGLTLLYRSRLSRGGAPQGEWGTRSRGAKPVLDQAQEQDTGTASRVQRWRRAVVNQIYHGSAVAERGFQLSASPARRWGVLVQAMWPSVQTLGLVMMTGMYAAVVKSSRVVSSCVSFAAAARLGSAIVVSESISPQDAPPVTSSGSQERWTVPSMGESPWSASYVSDTRMLADLGVQCLGADHWRWLSWLLPSWLMLFGVPGAVWWVLYREQSGLGSVEVRQRLGSLYEGIRPPVWWWAPIDLIVLAVYIVVLRVLVSSGAAVQAGAAGVVVLMRLCMISWARPFWHPAVNRLEMYLCMVLLASTASIFMTAYPTSGPAGVEAELAEYTVVPAMVMVVCNGLFVGWVGWQLLTLNRGRRNT